MIYETGVLNPYQFENMKMFLNNEIGTDFEFDNSEANEFVITVFDLEDDEPDKIREFEKNHLDEPYEKFRVVYKLKNREQVFLSEYNGDYLAVEDEAIAIAEAFGAQNFDYRMIDSSVKPYKGLQEKPYCEKGILLFHPGKQTAMFPDEPPLVVKHVNFLSGQIRYDLASEDGSINRRNISASKVHGYGACPTGTIEEIIDPDVNEKSPEELHNDVVRFGANSLDCDYR